MALQRVLEHIREVERRKLYLRRSKPNLFAYLTEVMGYSGPSAQRRIDAVRLARDVDDLLVRVGKGKISLGQIGVVQKGLRRKKISTESKRELMDKIEAAKPRDAERVVAEHLDLPPIKRSYRSEQRDGSMRVACTLSAKDWELYLKCRDLLGHKVPSGDLKDVLAELFRFYLSKKDPERKVTSGPEVKKKSPASSGLRKAARKPIPASVRRAVFDRDKVCQYRDPVSNSICGSTFGREVDHIEMVCRGGSNDLSNLRLLCRNHNQQAARDAGVKKPGEPKPKTVSRSGKNSPRGDPSR